MDSPGRLRQSRICCVNCLHHPHSSPNRTPCLLSSSLFKKHHRRTFGFVMHRVLGRPLKISSGYLFRSFGISARWLGSFSAPAIRSHCYDNYAQGRSASFLIGRLHPISSLGFYFIPRAIETNPINLKIWPFLKEFRARNELLNAAFGFG